MPKADAINEMNRSIRALALELPESIWRDVNEKWQSVLSEIQHD